MKDIAIWLLGNWQLLAGALAAMLSSAVGVLLIVPGSQGEPAIQKIADFFKKIAGKGIK